VAIRPGSTAPERRDRRGRRVSKRVLVVDDDRQMVKTIRAILEHRGWESIPAYSGEEAVAAATSGEAPFGAVLMDVRMPGMNGVEAFLAIHAAQPQTPVILMTAYAAPDLLAEAERDGVLRILPKPLPWTTLAGLLDEIAAWSGGVLVVDDDRAFGDTLEHVLAAAGRRVWRAATIDEAVALLAAHPPRVVVLDLLLDGIPPRESVAAIHEADPAVLLILCSGHPRLMDETLSSVPPQWVYAGLLKPFPPRQLLDLLEAANGG
jgi:two-component system, NtrC family, response regulator HydG